MLIDPWCHMQDCDCAVPVRVNGRRVRLAGHSGPFSRDYVHWGCSASFQSRPESIKDGVMLLGVKTSGTDDSGRFLQLLQDTQGFSPV